MSDPILHLSSSQSPVFLLNSRLGRFTAALIFILERLFSRSYETILPSSLATIHSSALGCSPRLPVSVYGTVCFNLLLRRFSRKYAWGHYCFTRRVRILSCFSSSDAFNYHYHNLSTSTHYSVSGQSLCNSVTPSQLNRYGNINPFPIGFAYRLLLRIRLTLI